MKWCLLIAVLLVSSCANVSTTRFTYQDSTGASVTLEMPKEIDATGLLVDIDAKGGRATVTAETWTSRNVETIQAQGEREAAVTGSAVEGAVKGAVKGLKTFP